MENTQLFIDMATTAWGSHVQRVTDTISKLSDEELSAATAPGRNSGIYLLGHLVAVNDYMLPLFGLRDRLYPELEETFIRKPDNATTERPTAEWLRTAWQELNHTLTEHFGRMTAEDWFGRHTSVPEEDFAKQPHRNKLNVLINRTNHQNYHLGQLVYLLKK
jgi:uncharacterized damage-inducible protein DinB